MIGYLCIEIHPDGKYSQYALTLGDKVYRVCISPKVVGIKYLRKAEDKDYGEGDERSNADYIACLEWVNCQFIDQNFSDEALEEWVEMEYWMQNCDIEIEHLDEMEEMVLTPTVVGSKRTEREGVYDLEGNPVKVFDSPVRD